MERNTDWKVPAAFILAGLSLIVALSGRNMLPFLAASQDPQSVIAIAQPDTQTPALSDPKGQTTLPKDMLQGSVPAKPGVPEMPGILKAPDSPDNAFRVLKDKLQQGYAFGDSGSAQGIWGDIQRLDNFLSPLLQVIALGLLLWLAYGYIMRRHRPSTYSVNQPYPPAAPAPPNSGDITRPE